MTARATFTIAFALLLLLTASTPATSQEKKLSSATVKKLVKEYCEDGSTQPRREEIAAQLKSTDVAEIGKHLGTYCKDDSGRSKALQLAISLKVPGLFKQLESGFNTLDQQAIIEWCLVLKDDSGVKFLLDKWNSLSLDSKEWGRIDEAFRQHRQSVETLDKFRDKAGDVARGGAAIEILKWQLEKPDLTEDQVKNNWGTLRAEFIRTYRTFPITGHAMLALEGWYGDKVEPAGPNIRVGVKGWWEFKSFPDAGNKSGFELVVHVCHLSGKEGYVGLFQRDDAGTQGFKFEFKPDQLAYCDPSGRVIKGVPYKNGEWQELKWVVTPKKDKWNCVMYVDGVRVLDAGEFFKAPTVMGFFSQDVEFLAGGADLRYAGK